MRDFNEAVQEICVKDSRYLADSYEFVAQALYFVQKKLKKQGHVSGKELLTGIREFAINQYGPMAKSVLKHWGISKTDDFGNIVFNLIEKKLFLKTDSDSLSDFKDIYDFEAAFGNVLENMVKRKISDKKSCQINTK